MARTRKPEPTPLEQLGPRRGDETPHELLYRAYLLGWIHFGTRLAILNRPGSPVFSAYENWGPLGLIAMMVVYTWITSSFGAAMTLLLVFVIAGVLILPRWVLKKLRMRVLDMAFGSEQGLNTLWDMGGIMFRLAHEPDIQCDSPDDDWQHFARAHLDKPDDAFWR